MLNRYFITACMLVALIFGAPSIAAEKPADATAPKSADNVEPSLDDLLKLPGADKAPKPDGDKPDVAPSKALTDAELADAFQKAVAEMADAASRLRVRQDPGVTTQRIQESVLTHLDQVIAAAQQQQQQQSSSGAGQQKQEQGSKQNQQKQNQPGQRNSQGNDPNKGEFSPGQATEPQPGGAIEETRVEWGSLPQRLRNELDQGLGEKFSPIYKKLTEAFYRRLAEEGKE